MWLQVAWLLPILQAVSGWVLVPITREVCKKVAASCKSRKAFINNTWWVVAQACICMDSSLELWKPYPSTSKCLPTC